ncbi:MAG: molybdenum cofactor guanylyltransferase [Microbacterium sp.]|uniref:molybdenum cofactor guanylyltransferase n=1 Tax=unclassified Microbacterium TaxID=2609290 RepID=UPI000DB669D2|nr:NTP transferase domain-containing protein [Microbacterium sp.]PZU40242.1 MAG: molybdenum cofactor guanylyltransferase [Microbacterium sp.]
MRRLDAIVLAGGRASRLGGAIKPLLEIEGRSLLTRAIDAAVDAGARRIVVASTPLGDDPRVTWVREDPPFGGPVAGIVAALPAIDAEWVLVLAADLPRAAAAVQALRAGWPDAAAEAATEGVCLVDAEHRAQRLTAVYRTASLRRVAAALPAAGRGSAVRALTDGLALSLVDDVAGASRDVDTWQDLEQARSLARAARTAPETESIMSDETSRTLPPEALAAWAAALRERFDLTEDDLPVSLILDLARDVAGDVARPAAPFSAFAAGLVAGRAGGTPAQVREAVAAIAALAADWAKDGA